MWMVRLVPCGCYYCGYCRRRCHHRRRRHHWVWSTIECDPHRNQSLMYHLVTMPWNIPSRWYQSGDSNDGWNRIASKW